MIVHSTPSRLHFSTSSSLLCCHNGSIGTDYNYNKSATIPRSVSLSPSNKDMSSTAANRVARQQQQQLHQQCRTRRSTMVAGSPSRRALAKREHQRSLRYTRTLDIIPEDDSGSSGFSTPQEQLGGSSAARKTETVIATDFWHSQRGMKKSATSVSLGSLLSDSEASHNDQDTSGDDRNPRGHRSNNGCPTAPVFFVEDDNDEGYDNFLEDWDL